MKTITLEELLEAGCHFGHQVTRQNPKARDFIFEERDGIHIIDLEKTKEGLEEAAVFVKDLAKRGGTLVVLGTKKQAETVLKEEMDKVKQEGIDGLYWVTKRWIGGTFTNFPEVSKNFKKLKQLKENLQNEFEKAKYTKREVGLWEKERQKLEVYYGGIAGMKRPPEALFIIDSHLEYLAVFEAKKTGVKTLGITDTNSDPSLIDYPIPANDDAVGSIKLITDYIIDAWIEGRKAMGKEEKKGPMEEDKKAEKKKDKNTKTEEKKVKTSKEKTSKSKKTNSAKADKEKKKSNS